MAWHRWLTPPALVLCAGAGYAETFMTVEGAQAALFPGEHLTRVDVTLTRDQAKAIERESGVNVRVKQLQVWRTTHGASFYVDQVLGKHDFITWALAIGDDGSVRGLEILEYREAYGGEIRNAKWRAQFTGKRRGAPLKLDADIRNISAATLSCRHITDGVKRLLATNALVFSR